MKIAVIGGFGLMAEASLNDLAANPDVEKVFAADLNLDRSEAVLSKIPNRKKIVALALDLTDTASAAAKLKGADVLLNCAWYEFNLKAMDLSLALRAHYVDLGGLYHMTLKQLARNKEFEKAGLLAVLGCGSTPGITNMMVERMSEDFEKIETVGIYDASFDPSLSADSFIPPFSIRTMLDECEKKAPVLKAGRIEEVAPFADVEELEFKEPIGHVKVGAIIHSEAATLPGYLKKKEVRELFFKIAYQDQVKRQLDLLVGMGFSLDAPVAVNGSKISPRRFLTALARKNVAAMSVNQGPSRDFEILRVKVTGVSRKRPTTKVWDCEITPIRHLSAGALGVGVPAVIAGILAASGRVKKSSGTYAPESALKGCEFFKELLARKAFSFHETLTTPVEIQ